MDASFWHAKWEKNEIGFHQKDINPFLQRYFGELSLPAGSRIFVPLCGKTKDIHWLLASGYRVAGAELSRLAIEHLFADLGVVPRIAQAGELTHFAAADIDIYVGDIFALTASGLGTIDAVYDRAALVALPAPMRPRYASHLMEITGLAPQLLITYEYDQNLADGPPFSIGSEEVHRHYARSFDVTPLASADVPGGLKGKCPAQEHVWLLERA